MTDFPRIEELLRAELAAEAEDLPFLVDADRVRARMARGHRRRWSTVPVVPLAAAATVLAVLVAQGLISHSSSGNGPGASNLWGPLAVLPSTGGDEALSVGKLVITDTCVLLEGGGGSRELLVWPGDRTRWEADARAIDFTNRDGSSFTLREGDIVRFGGGGDATAEGGAPAEEWVAGLDWVNPPDPSCYMEVRWFVGEVVSAAPGMAQIPMPDEQMSAVLVEPPRGAITASEAVELARSANAQVGDTPIVNFMEVHYATPEPDSPLADFVGWVILSSDIYLPRSGPVDTPQGGPAFGCAWVFVDVDGEIVADWSDGCPDPLSSLPSAAGAAVPTPAGVTRDEAIEIAAAADPDSSAHVVRAEAGLFGDLVGRALAAYVDSPPPSDRWVWLVDQATRPGFGAEGSVVIIDFRTGEVYGVVEWIS